MTKVEMILLLAAFVPWSLVGLLALGMLKFFREGRGDVKDLAREAFSFLKAQSLEEKTRMDYLSKQPPVVQESPQTSTAQPGRELIFPESVTPSMVDELVQGKPVKDVKGQEWELV